MAARGTRHRHAETDNREPQPTGSDDDILVFIERFCRRRLDVREKTE